MPSVTDPIAAGDLPAGTPVALIGVDASGKGVQSTSFAADKAATEAARDAAVVGLARTVRRMSHTGRNLFDKNASGIATDTLIRATTGATTTSGASGYNTSGSIPVEAGQTLIATRTIGYPASATYGIAFFDASDTFISGLPASGSVPIAPGTQMAVPSLAVSARFCARVSTKDWEEMHLSYGTSVPTAQQSFRLLDRITGRKEAQKAVRQRDRSKFDLALPEEYIRGAYRSTSGALVLNANYAISNLIAGYPGMRVTPTASVAGSLGVAYYDIDGNWLYTGNQATLTGTITSGTASLEITTADGYAPAVGTPITNASLPAGTYITARSASRTPCTLTLSANATGDVTSGTFLAQGTLAGVPITFPEEACFAEFPMTASQMYWAQFLSTAPVKGDIFRGARHDYFAGLPLAGQETYFEGDSIMQSSAAGTGQPTTIPPGAAATVGVLQYLLQMQTQCDVVEYRGQSGKQLYQALDTYGTVVALAAENFAGASVKGSMASGDTTLTVSAVYSGELVVGRRITAPGLPEGTYIAALGTGTGGTGTYSLSKAAIGTISIGIFTVPPVKNYVDQNITNSWGMTTLGDGARAYAQVQLGALGDTWTPTVMNITFTSGSTAITINSTSKGAAADGMPICAVGGAKTPPGTTLVHLGGLGGGAWGLSQAAIDDGSVTVRGGTFYGDLHDIHITKVNAWSPTTRQILVGALRRFDGTAAVSNAGGVDYYEGDPVNDEGARLSDFNTAKRLFAERWGFHFVDTFRDCQMTSAAYPSLYSDKLHPKTQGVVEVLAPFLSGEINNLQPIGRYS